MKIVDRDFYTNAKGYRLAQKKAVYWFKHIHNVEKVTVYSHRMSPCDEYGDNYWFHLEGETKEV